MKPIEFTKEELEALAHALGNVLCQWDHPDWEILSAVREQIRKELEVNKNEKAIQGAL